MFDFDVAAVEKAAEHLIKKGIQVFPAHFPLSSRSCSCGNPSCKHNGKHPRTHHGLKDGTIDAKIIKTWKGPYNLCAVTGSVSGVFVLDVDPDKGGAESLRHLEKLHGKLPHTWRSLTGGEGTHFIFRHPGYPVKNRTGFHPGLDIRGDGGYIVAPPSVHRSGRTYEWDATAHPDDTQLVDAPSWLLDEIQKDAVHKARPAEEWAKEFQKSLEEGERNSKITSFAGHLLRKHVDPYVTLELLMAFNDARGEPPLEDDEVFNCVQSIARSEVLRRTGRKNGY